MNEIFECQCCGHCCHGGSTVSVSAEERKRIARFLGMDASSFLEGFCVVKGKRVEMRIREGHCIFYNDDGLCAIHEVKPFHCKRWPLHPSILGDESAWKAIQADCPGFKKNVSYTEVCDLIRKVNDEP